MVPGLQRNSSTLNLSNCERISYNSASSFQLRARGDSQFQGDTDKRRIPVEFGAPRGNYSFYPQPIHGYPPIVEFCTPCPHRGGLHAKGGQICKALAGSCGYPSSQQSTRFYRNHMPGRFFGIRVGFRKGIKCPRKCCSSEVKRRLHSRSTMSMSVAMPSTDSTRFCTRPSNRRRNVPAKTGARPFAPTTSSAN